MSEDTLKLAQTLLDVTKRAHDRSASFIGTCGEMQDVAAAYIDIHERMGRITEEAEKHHEDSCASHYSDDPPCDCQVSVILALTKGTK